MTGPIAVVDMGSNSLHLQVEGEAGPLLVERSPVQLGKLVDGRLDPAAVAEALRVLQDWRDEASQLGADRLYVGATASLRSPSDPETLVDAAQALGIEIRVLSGEEEGEWIWYGARAGLGFSSALVMDMGGRSTELALGGPGGVSWVTSLDVGHLSLAAAPDPESLMMLRLRPVLPQLRTRPLPRAVATGGTALTLGRMAAHLRGEPLDDADRTAATAGEIEDVVESLLHHGPGRVAGSDPRRAATLVAGCVGWRTLVRQLGLPGLTFSRSSLRSGLIQAARLGIWT